MVETFTDPSRRLGTFCQASKSIAVDLSNGYGCKADTLGATAIRRSIGSAIYSVTQFILGPRASDAHSEEDDGRARSERR